MANLVQVLKEQEQDFEFYPTTDEIIHAMVRDLRLHRDHHWRSHGRDQIHSVLDVGAGSGKVLSALKEYADIHKLYAIEKSIVLCEQLPEDVFILGTDFMEQSLVSKSVDMVFSNPPFSQFEEWAVKIIREAASRLVYLVIPQRWTNSGPITEALKFREAEFEVVGRFTFRESEDREARGWVHLVRVLLAYETDDAFSRFFNSEFADLRARFEGKKQTDKAAEDGEREHQKEKQEAKYRQLVVGPSYPDRMVELYNEEVDHIQRNYRAVAQLDPALMREFEITPLRVLECLKARLAGLKNTYWQELISNLSQVTDRLTSKRRRALLDKLKEAGHVDFTLTNIHAIVVWVLKNANQYVDEQLIELFERMVEKANVYAYKSNERVFTDNEFRYGQTRPTHIALEYRLVLTHCGGVSRRSFSNGECELDDTGAEFIGDLMTVARNLGFICKTNDDRLNYSGRKLWLPGKLQTFNLESRPLEVGDRITWSGTSKKKIQDRVALPDGCWQYQVDGQWYHQRALPGEPLVEVRGYLNRNLHIRLSQDVMLALNVEYGRLKGWLRDGAEAAKELANTEAARYFNTQIRLGTGTLPMLQPPARGETDSSAAA